jgi:hypothetical protein
LSVECSNGWSAGTLEAVASSFSLPLGETDPAPSGPVRAKEWVWKRGRVRIDSGK